MDQNKIALEDTSQFLLGQPNRANTKIDPIGKLHIIFALDNGQSKGDIAKQYGVHPQTITYIYKQKDSIIKKYIQKYNCLKTVQSANLDQILLEWFLHQINHQNLVNEEQLYSKAQDIIKPIRNDFDCIDDWLLHFRLRHNIMKYELDVEFSLHAKEEWMKFLKGLDIKNVYLGGTCALSHSLDLNDYIKETVVDKHVSLLFIVNVIAANKRELVVVGQEVLDPEVCVQSLPIKYYHCDIPQLDLNIIRNYLGKWNEELKTEGRNVTLAMNLPENVLDKLKFDSITVISIANMVFVIKIIEKIVECFKYNYRRLQISRNVYYDRDSRKTSLSDYIHMMSLAWYNVPSSYIQRLFFPPEDGTLYFAVDNDTDGKHSLFEWCKMFNIPINLDLYSDSLEKYMFCDKGLPSINLRQSDTIQRAVELPCQSTEPLSTSGMDAYQAMKRLISYLQCESAGESVIKSAKCLENHLEYGALLEIHQIIASTNSK